MREGLLLAATGPERHRQGCCRDLRNAPTPTSVCHSTVGIESDVIDVALRRGDRARIRERVRGKSELRGAFDGEAIGRKDVREIHAQPFRGYLSVGSEA